MSPKHISVNSVSMTKSDLWPYLQYRFDHVFIDYARMPAPYAEQNITEKTLNSCLAMLFPGGCLWIPYWNFIQKYYEKGFFGIKYTISFLTFADAKKSPWVMASDYTVLEDVNANEASLRCIAKPYEDSTKLFLKIVKNV
jgi:hypothetical protein